MSSNPFPTFARSSGKLLAGFGMGLVVAALHINPLLLNIVAMLAETINALITHSETRLKQLQIFIIGRGHCSINSTRDKKVDMTSTGNNLVIQLFFFTKNIGQIIGIGIKDGHFLTIHFQRIFAPTRDEQVTAVHRILKNIHQRNALRNEIHRRHQ